MTTAERPILMSGDMVRAILDGRKTQTRRAVKPQPISGVSFREDGTLREWCEGLPRCPYGSPGDRLWVRETHLVVGAKDSDSPRVVYRATNHGPDAWVSAAWTPSIHMPRWASRITLEVVAVRVERVQDISALDIEAEGLPPGDWYRVNGGAEKWFRAVWNALAPDGCGWSANPWVWVVEFRRVEGGR